MSDINNISKSGLSTEETLAFLLEADDDLIAVLDSNGNFSMINRNGAKSLGYSAQEMIGKYYQDYLAPDSKEMLDEIMSKVLACDDLVTFNAGFIDRYSQEIYYKVRIKKSVTKDGGIAGLLFVGTNITNIKKQEQKQKELNEKLVEANRIISIERERAKSQITILEELNRLKGNFVSNVSHELRTPLASIVGFAETIASDHDLSKEMVLEFNNIILTEGKRLAKFIENILDFSKLEEGDEKLNKSPCDLVEIVLEVLGSYSKQAKEKGITIEQRIPEAEMVIFADKERLCRAISNIVNNAIKFTKDGGRVTVIAQDFLKEVELVISDTGIGIPEKDIPNIFGKFNKLDRPGKQYPGTGMGLFAAHQIISLHKGLIKIKSEVNSGTSVIIRLPKK